MPHKATVFEFTSYEFPAQGGSASGGEPSLQKAVFHYKTEFSDRESILFNETILLPKIPELENIPKELVQKLLESLHIILGISYYKFYCATKVIVPYTLSKGEADFWNTVYKKGLGEFFYQNKLDTKHSPKFSFDKTKKSTNYSLPTTNRSLVGIGGGKDSIVLAELLKEQGFNITSFVTEAGKESALVKKVIELIGAPQLSIQRILDPKVHDTHQFNGHIPISAIYAFLGVFSAVLYGYSYVIVGNEQSSNFGNITYNGLDINHQWSKSFEFEKLFQNYVKNYITPSVVYFSLLRSFYEIRIVKLFSKYPKYFSHFSSCNTNFKINKTEIEGLWCGKCPKCVFVFILLSAYLPKKELLNIFGKNLYEDEGLSPLFSDVLGFGKMKPFDCVGTFDEAQTALLMAQKKFAKDFIVRQIGSKAKYHKEVFLTNKEAHIPEAFKFLGMESAYILGYGKEGKITKEYVKKQYPKMKIGVGDGAKDKKYLEKQENFDIAIKTPGIKKELVTIPYTTATNIFFSQVIGKNLTIGVTGSKGKSTTASLIYHILKTAGKEVQLLGNIGTPMLGALLNPVKLDTIFVLELSSYQLEDITFSPNIAVITNLFPEHMDFHGSLQNYYNAKKNIYRFQKSGDHFIDQVKATQKYETNLLGQHNQNNIQVAVEVAKILEIPEETITEAIKSFKGLPHRLELVGEFNGIKFYDDAISTTPDSTIMAIEALKNVDTIFLGGQDRGYNFSPLEKVLKKYNIKNVVLFPDSGNNMLKQAEGFNILKTKSMKEAVRFAYKHTTKGKICLLSCASPSYSVWKNFEEKGDQFKKFVKELST